MSNESTAEPPRPPIVERARWFQLTEAASVGIEMAAAVGVGAGLGIYLERNVTHWAPWTTYIGLGIGLSAAVLAVLRTARNFTRMIAAEEAAEAEAAIREARAQADIRPRRGRPR
jgi:F0F1-type ATP synthase assembly protein I